VDVVCFGQQNWDFCWTGKQQLTTRLARRGHRVFYVDPDIDVEDHGFSAAVRTLAPSLFRLGLREVEPNLFVYTHRYSPFTRWRGTLWRHPRLLRAWLRRLGFRGAVALTLQPRILDLDAIGGFRAHVHYAIDEMTGYGGLADEERRRIRRLEGALVRRSDRVLAISPRLLARLRRLHPDCHLLPSGADLERFSPARIREAPLAEELRSLPGPVIGFVGQVDERIDQALVARLARARPAWRFVFVGRTKPGVDLSALSCLANVHLLEYRPHSQLPGYLKGMTVCVVPYVKSPLTEAASPLKVYEYLASGLPVVSVPLDGLLDCRGVVEIASEPADFLASLERCVAQPEAGRRERLEVAARNSWARRVRDLEGHLAAAVAKRSEVVAGARGAA
jgi:glycosyltransferase involved in cell wall biosynthesis